MKAEVENVIEWFKENVPEKKGDNQAGGIAQLDDNAEDQDGVSENEFEKLFTLKKVAEKYVKKFTLTQIRYDVEIVPLTEYFDNVKSMVVLPKVFEAIFKICTKDFQPMDKIIIELSRP